MKNLIAILSLSLAVLAGFNLPGCTSKSLKSAPPLQPKNVDEFSVMSFNVENLFDDKHDADREDFTFMPVAQKNKPEIQKFCNEQKGYYKRECLEKDWNASLIEKKLKNVSEVILSVDEKKGPDILFLVEVENDNILSQLNKKYLQAAGYQNQVLIEGPDLRGIDVALLSRFPLDGKPQLHKIPYKGETAEDQKWMNRSRGILEVPLKLPNGSKLTALVAHFPSQSNPRYWRAQSIAYAKKLIQEQPSKNMVIFGGDLNITHDENEEAGFISKELSSVGLVSHLVGCKSCDGTHNYRNDWSFLDVLVFSKNFDTKGSAPYALEPETIDVVRYTKNHLYKGNAPKRFNESGEGVSDHFPIYARFKLKTVTYLDGK
jgi:endonuclease/exonuclease/phosphatase family metal-dependent hydrolase